MKQILGLLKDTTSFERVLFFIFLSLMVLIVNLNTPKKNTRK
jgi:hypothetical protein